MSETQVGTSGGTETLVRPQAGGGDTAHRAHIVKRPEGSAGGASAYITEARVMGFEVEALCGYRWIPARDPEKYPVCEACRDILAAAP